MAIYAPQNVARADEERDLMYSGMEEGFRTAPRGSTVIMGGDFNAQIGRQTQEDQPATVGHFERGTRNAAGEQLVSRCNEESFKIADTFTAQTNKTTWQNPQRGSGMP